jgi:NOL1/NOP2/fmu family ribosome biogenesis protein
MKITDSLEVLNSKEIKEIMRQLEAQFDFTEKLNYVFLRNNKEKVYITTRDIEKIDLTALRIDSIGLYFGKYYNDGFRLSIEGAQLIADRCKKNVVELSMEQKHEWLLGKDIPLEGHENSFVILQWKNDVLGCAKVKHERAFNSIPSSRTLHVVNENIDEITENIVDE